MSAVEQEALVEELPELPTRRVQGLARPAPGRSGCCAASAWVLTLL